MLHRQHRAARARQRTRRKNAGFVHSSLSCISSFIDALAMSAVLSGTECYQYITLPVLKLH
jgi:hypothetical protein